MLAVFYPTREPRNSEGPLTDAGSHVFSPDVVVHWSRDMPKHPKLVPILRENEIGQGQTPPSAIPSPFLLWEFPLFAGKKWAGQ